MVNVHDCNNGISDIHGEELPEQLSIHREQQISHSNKCSTYLQDWCLSKMRLETIGWENHSWKYLSLIGDERVINLQRTKVYVFSDSVMYLGKILETLPIERCMRTNIGMVKIFFKITETLKESSASQWNSSGLFLQDSVRCSSVKKSRVYC